MAVGSWNSHVSYDRHTAVRRDRGIPTVSTTWLLWWLNRGYTPAGVEAWNCIRALDYLQSREEVDGERLE